jgi:hypothetical protein
MSSGHGRKDIQLPYEHFIWKRAEDLLKPLSREMYETGQMELEDIETFDFQIFNGSVDVAQYNIQDSNRYWIG